MGQPGNKFLDSGIIIAVISVIFASGVLWYKVEALADDQDSLEDKAIPERVVRIEEQVKANGRAIERSREEVKKNHDLLVELISKIDE